MESGRADDAIFTAGAFSDGLAVVEQDWLSSYINNRGELVVPLSFHIAHQFAEGVASVGAGQKWGYVDRDGRLVLAAQYDFAMPFCAGLAEVIVEGDIPKHNPSSLRIEGGLEGIFGLIDHSGHFVSRDSSKKQWLPSVVK